MAIGRTNAGGGGGGSGATLTITGVAGATVTASKDGKTYTRTINSSGTAMFKGLSTGTWTVTMSGSGQTTTRTVEITADYSLTIAFFSATISITYPAASTCVVTDSTGATVASDTNADSAAKTWTATVGATGTYTITATSTSGGKTKSTTVSITAEGQVATVVLTYELVIYNAGTFGENVDGTLFSAEVNNADIEENSTAIHLSSNRRGNGIFYIKQKVNCAGYKTLKMSMTDLDVYVHVGGVNFGLKTNNTADKNDFVAITEFANGTPGNVFAFEGNTTLSVDVSNVGSTTYYIALQFSTPNLEAIKGHFYANITKIWLE